MERIKQGGNEIGRRKDRSRKWMNEDIKKTFRNKEVCKETVNFLEDGKWGRKKKRARKKEKGNTIWKEGKWKDGTKVRNEWGRKENKKIGSM